MTPRTCHFENLAHRQYGVAAGWQLVRSGLIRQQAKAAMRGRTSVFRDVCALGDLDQLGCTWPPRSRTARPAQRPRGHGATPPDPTSPSTRGQCRSASTPLGVVVDERQRKPDLVVPRTQYEEDRRRTLVHVAAGWAVLRPSAIHVQHQPGLVLDAIRGLAGW